jgi:hypothetical protein
VAHEAEVAIEGGHVPEEGGSAARPGARQVSGLQVLEQVNGQEGPLACPERCHQESRPAVVDADLQGVARDALGGDELVVGHEE